jgi:DNA-binding response OmpR family regulator
MNERSDQPTVLVVEDLPSARELLRIVVQRVDPLLRVVLHPTAEEALAWCECNLADVVVVDYKLPGMNGLELISRLRGLSAYHTVPILMITTQADAVSRSAATLGTVDVLRKPASPQVLAHKIATLLRIRGKS